MAIAGEQSRAEVFGTLGPLKAYGFPVSNGSVRLVQEDEDVEVFVDLLDDSRTVLSSEVHVELERRRVSIPRLVLAPTPRVMWGNKGIAHFSLRDEGLANIDVTMSSPQGLVSMKGDLDPQHPYRQTRAQVLFLRCPRGVVSELRELSGQTDVALSLRGDADSPRLDAQLQGDRLWLPGISKAINLDAALHLAGEVSLRSRHKPSPIRRYLWR